MESEKLKMKNTKCVTGEAFSIFQFSFFTLH